MAPLVVAATLVCSGCVDRTDFSGTYVGDGNGIYQPRGGASTELGIPRDAISVKMTSRHYQYSEVEVTVRGCVLRSNGGGETTWGLSGRDGGKCTFDVPSVGNVELSLSGHVAREPPTRSSRPAKVRLVLQGGSEKVETFRYTLDAAPIR